MKPTTEEAFESSSATYRTKTAFLEKTIENFGNNFDDFMEILWNLFGGKPSTEMQTSTAKLTEMQTSTAKLMTTQQATSADTITFTISSDNDTEVTTESMTTPTTAMETTTEPIGPVDFSFAVERITENSAVLVIFGGSIVTSWDVYVYGENETLAQRMTKTRKSILTRIQISNLEQDTDYLVMVKDGDRKLQTKSKSFRTEFGLFTTESPTTSVDHTTVRVTDHDVTMVVYDVTSNSVRMRITSVDDVVSYMVSITDEDNNLVDRRYKTRMESEEFVNFEGLFADKEYIVRVGVVMI